MAIIDHKGFVRGTVGPSVFRKYREKNIIQSKPRKHKLTANTLTSAAEFGLISSAAATMRYAFEPAYGYSDGKLNGRAFSAISKCIRNSSGTISGQRDLHDADLSYLEGLEFNMNSPLSETFLIKPQISKTDEDKIIISMPALDMRSTFKKPRSLARKGNLLRIRFLLVAFNYRQNFFEYIDNQETDYFEYKMAESRTIIMNGSAPEGCLLMLSMSLSLYGDNILDKSRVLLNSTEFSPSAIIATWQNDPTPLHMDPAPAEEAKDYRSYMDYAGNRLIAELPRRIARFARPDKTGKGSGTYTSAKTKVRPPEQFTEKPNIQVGKRISF